MPSAAAPAAILVRKLRRPGADVRSKEEVLFIMKLSANISGLPEEVNGMKMLFCRLADPGLPPAGSYDPVPERFGHGFASTIDMQLGVDIPDVPPHRIDADMTITGDHLIAKSFYQLSQHLFFPVCKMILQSAGC